MFGKWLASIVILLAVVAAVASDMEARVRSQCLHCHGAEKLCVETTDVAWWERAVARMLWYDEGLLAPEEIPAMAAWLADPAHRQPWCPLRP